jgi:diguanylate cyclase (GGDEF)-like protein
MGIDDELARAELPEEAHQAVAELAERDDVPEDIKEHYLELRKRLAHVQSALDNTADEVRQLTDQLKVRERREKKLQRKLIYNQKTGLPNHYLMERDVSAVINEAQQSTVQRQVTLLIVALDERYHTVKRTLSPTVSEWVLYQIGERLGSLLPSNGRLYHTRDSEFVILLVNAMSEEYIPTFAERISAVMEEQFQFPDYTVNVGCKIGAAVYPDDASTKQMLLRNADLALSVAQKSKEHFARYEEEMSEVVIEKMELQNSIIRALEEQAITEINKQFTLYYQPVVQILEMNDASVHHRVVGAESLIRWNHPTRGMIPPGRFIPVAEETGLIIPIGNWALFTASDQLHAWSQTSLNNIYVSVNLSPRQFRDEYLLSNIERALNRNEIDPSLLKLEVTEGLVMEDPEDSISKLQAIQKMGITISIDDFGTGYSSLNYLKRLPIDLLKLDKTFIDDVLTNPQTQRIVRAVMSMASGMGMDVIAEGIEEHEQIEFLYEEGCSIIQGFYFGEPLSAYDFQKRLQERYNGLG